MFRAPQDDSDSDDERNPNSHNLSMHQNFGFNHRAFDKPLLNTPLRLKCAAGPSTSSSSSSSSSSSIFDGSLVRAGTPITPAHSETPDSSDAGRPRLSSHGKLSTSSFVERCVDTITIPLATPALITSSTAKRPSQFSSDSDYELLIEGVKKLSVRDDEQVSNTRGSLGLDISPTPAGRAQLKKKSRQSIQRADDYSQSPVKNGVSNRKNKHQNTSWKDETPSAEPKVQCSFNLAGARSTPESSKRKVAETPSHIIVQIDNEGKEVDADSAGETAPNPSHPIQYQQKATLSSPQASHNRPASDPGPQIKSNIIKQDTTSASTSSRNASPTQTKEVAATATLAPTRCSSRRRSTGSAVPENTVLQIIEVTSHVDEKIAPKVFPDKSINLPEVSRQIPSSEPPERTPDLHPDETSKSPELEHMHPEKKNKNDLKNETLRIIRRQKSKPAAASTLIHGYLYIFKSKRFKGHVKIGSTVNAPDVRITNWSTTCNFQAIQIMDKNDKAFRFCRIVEQIVHAQLWNKQKRFLCGKCKSKHVLKMTKEKKGTTKTELDVGPTEHGGWFEISESQALEVVNKWRDWMIHQNPYQKDATLRSCWMWKYDMGSNWMKGTEAEWVVWRQLRWLEYFRFDLYELNKWLGELSPLLQALANLQGSVFVLAVGIYLGTAGVNLTNWLKVETVLLLYRFMRFKFC